MIATDRRFASAARCVSVESSNVEDLNRLCPVFTLMVALLSTYSNMVADTRLYSKTKSYTSKQTFTHHGVDFNLSPDSNHFINSTAMLAQGQSLNVVLQAAGCRLQHKRLDAVSKRDLHRIRWIRGCKTSALAEHERFRRKSRLSRKDREASEDG